MECEYQNFCGGCLFRDMDEADYQRQKENSIKDVLGRIKQEKINFGKTVFIPDGLRRRTSLAFMFNKGNLFLGYNRKKTHTLVDCYKCLLLTHKINNNLLNIRELIEAIGDIPFIKKEKKKVLSSYLQKGDVYICEADNGLDVVLEFDNELTLEHRMQIAETSWRFVDIIRISHRKKAEETAEVIVEKAKPVINIKGTDVFISAGNFLQASKAAETALIDLVMKYIGTSSGRCLDLFCGIGTFSYPLSLNIRNKITAVDSSKEALSAFENTVKNAVIPNISIKCKNLFKYPLSGEELKGYDIMVFDPPRAGALAQMQEIDKLLPGERPKKIVAVSCNPESFVTDANILLDCGYKISEITIVDQFIYSPHAEVVALFEKNA